MVAMMGEYRLRRLGYSEMLRFQGGPAPWLQDGRVDVFEELLMATFDK